MRSTHVLLVGVLLVLVSAFTVLAVWPESRNASGLACPTIPGGGSDLENQKIGAGPEISIYRTELNFGAVVSGTHTSPQ